MPLFLGLLRGLLYGLLFGLLLKPPPTNAIAGRSIVFFTDGGRGGRCIEEARPSLLDVLLRFSTGFLFFAGF